MVENYLQILILRRPSGLPSEDIKDHVLSVKLEFQDKLKEKLKQVYNILSKYHYQLLTLLVYYVPHS